MAGELGEETMTENEARELVNEIIVKAEEVIKADGYHTMIFLVVLPEGMEIVSMHPVIEEAERLFDEGRPEEALAVKKRGFDQVRKLASDNEASGAIMISEAWISVVKPKDVTRIYGESPGEDIVKAPIPRFQKDRQEALVVSWEFRLDDGSRFDGSSTTTFTRDEDGNVILGKRSKAKGSSTGTFTGLIPNMPT